MQHGEKGATVPRQISKVIGRGVCHDHNAGIQRRKPAEHDWFLYGHPADMKKVEVVVKGRRSPK